MRKQLIELIEDNFNQRDNIDLILTTPRFTRRYHRNLIYSYLYNQYRPMDKLINFIDKEYFKLLYNSISTLIESNYHKLDSKILIKISDTKLELEIKEDET